MVSQFQGKAGYLDEEHLYITLGMDALSRLLLKPAPLHQVVPKLVLLSFVIL